MNSHNNFVCLLHAITEVNSDTWVLMFKLDSRIKWCSWKNQKNFVVLLHFHTTSKEKSRGRVVQHHCYYTQMSRAYNNAILIVYSFWISVPHNCRQYSFEQLHCLLILLYLCVMGKTCHNVHSCERAYSRGEAKTQRGRQEEANYAWVISQKQTGLPTLCLCTFNNERCCWWTSFKVEKSGGREIVASLPYPLFLPLSIGT